MIPADIQEKINGCKIVPTNGRVCVIPLVYKPSKILEVVSNDNADITEGYVASLSPHKFARKKKGKGDWINTGVPIPHDVEVGDRVIFRPQYVTDDFIRLNAQEYRLLDAWDIYCKITADRTEGYVNPLTGDTTPEKPRTLIFND